MSLVRVNTRIPDYINDWLNEEAEKTGVPKTTLIFLALDTYIKQREAMDMMTGMSEIMAKLEKLEQKI